MKNLEKRAEKFHERAMCLVDYAFLYKRQGNLRLARKLYRQAHRFESKATRIAFSLRALPTYEILLESTHAIWQSFLRCSS